MSGTGGKGRRGDAGGTRGCGEGRTGTGVSAWYGGGPVGGRAGGGDGDTSSGLIETRARPPTLNFNMII